ncbi:polar localization protein TipN [Phenylobacterium sp.]|uniref:polar localization protein TipN n=1 Tax=Phenylobacterium sp. TaxID=1871053 RepID=UPI0027349E97|nr:polar localization protein TipN [Phenylobacterium sp.]MDP3854355.1 polar localization protein TipN [Phenylobacterium sp.]
MKIKKRHQPVDFQTLGDEGLAHAPPPVDPAELELSSRYVETSAEEELFALPPLPPPREAEPSAAAPLSPIPPLTEVTTATPQALTRRPQPAEEAPGETSSGWPIYLAAFVVSVLWAAAPIAFAWGYRRAVAPFDYDPFALTVFGLMAVGPALFVWLAAYMVRQAQKLGAETRRAKGLADEMVTPALAAGAQTYNVVVEVREEISRATAAALEACEGLMALREALAAESDRLVEATANSVRTATGLVETLGRERDEMGGLSKTLDAQATAVSDTITQQARMVAEASDLAETQLREAEAALAARAADMAAAAGETSDAARTAAEDLTRHIARLETAGLGVAEQIIAVEKGLTEHRAGLVTAAHALRGDHENFAVQAESHAAQLAEFISQARLSTVEMGDRAVKGGEALRQMIVQAAEQFRDLAEQARAERDEFGQSTLNAMEAVSQAAAAERARLEDQTRATIEALGRAAEETRQAAERHAETARNQVDQLSEAAFTAGQQANKVFESRLAEARALIEHSTQMVEQAGAATAGKLEEGARTARATLDELAAMLGDIETRAAQLPATARGQAEQVRKAVADSIDDMMDHARRTADETQAIDEVFQERVRRNYEMLSEAVRMMGAVASTSAMPPPVSAVRERIARPEARPAPKTEPQPAPESTPPPPVAVAAPEPVVEAAQIVESVAEVEPELELTEPVKASDAKPNLRQRLRLTPTATDSEFSQVFGQAGGRTEDGQGGEGWTWKDLLSAIDETDGDTPHHHAPLEDTLAGEIGAMGIDPAALLPRSRIDELAAAIQARDLDGAREVVRRLAPAASRRLARRLATDEALKGQVMTYLARYHHLLDDAATRDHEGFLVATLLSSEAGRTYLLFDAAVGDLA